MTTLVTRARTIPRTLIGTTLHAARLPLSTVQRVTGQRGNDEWPPALAFERAEATVETALGSLLRDDEIVARGRLRRARLAKLREAAELDAAAEEHRAQASDELEARREQAERRLEQVERRTQERERQAEQQAQQRARRADKQAAARKQAVRREAAATEQVVDRQERQARLDATQAQAEAVRAERAALSAEDSALAADEALEQAREDRRSG